MKKVIKTIVYLIDSLVIYAIAYEVFPAQKVQFFLFVNTLVIINNLYVLSFKRGFKRDMIPKNMKSRDMVGMEVKTAKAIKNGAGIVVPKGKPVRIASFGRAFTIRTDDCSYCGLSAYISGVTRDDVELISESNKKITNADSIKSMSIEELTKLLCGKFCHGVGENLIKEWLESECDAE